MRNATGPLPLLLAAFPPEWMLVSPRDLLPASFEADGDGCVQPPGR